MELLANFLVFALCYAGLSSLCLARDRHYADLHGRGAEPPAPLRRRLQWTGSLALAATHRLMRITPAGRPVGA